MADPFSFAPIDDGEEAAAAEAARQAAALRLRRGAIAPRDEGARAGYRQEGAATDLPFNVMVQPFRVAGGLLGALMDQSAEENPLQVMRPGETRTISTDYDPRRHAAALNAETGLNLIGLPGLATSPLEAGAVGSAALRRSRDLPMDEASRLQRMRDQGYEPGWYHGGMRMDRFTENGRIDPRRATSGPMPFFTDSPEMASSYASGKKPDTSLIDTGEVPNYFTVKQRDVFPGTQARSPMTVEQSWHFLPPEVKAEIADRAKRIGFEDRDMGSGPFTLHPPGEHAGPSSAEHWDYTLKQNRGNVLSALRDLWHDSGYLVGNESELSNIYKLAGYPHPISEATAPWTEARGVFPAALRMRNPLNTDDAKVMTEQVLPALEQAFKRDRTRKQEFGADMWDKNTRYTPREWVEQAKESYAKGDNSFVWTSIPDKVTAELKRLGYDGILDTGGKMGGPGHRVAIPFDPSQVRSQFARFDPANEGKPFLLGANAADRKTGAAIAAANEAPAFGSLHPGVKTPGLPMDEASRLQRAADQGFNVDAYHSTDKTFDAFKRRPIDVGIHFGTPGQANDRFDYLRERGGRAEEGAQIIPAKLKLQNPLRVRDVGGFNQWNLPGALEDAGIPKAEIDAAMRSSRSPAGQVAAMRDLIERKGYDGLVYRNTGEVEGAAPLQAAQDRAWEKLKESQRARGKPISSFDTADQATPEYKAYSEAYEAQRKFREENGVDSHVVFRPNQVRSQFAAFDPANKKSGFLLGANAADKKTAAAVEGANTFGSIAPDRLALDQGGRVQMGAVTRDVVPFPSDTANNRLRNQMTRDGDFTVADIPIRSMYSTQKTANPDFAQAAKRAGDKGDGYDLPAVFRVDGKNYLTDGHHRVADAATKGGTARVRFYDMDKARSGEVPDPRQMTLLANKTDKKTGAAVEAANDFGSISPKAPAAADYRGEHGAPGPDSGSPMHDVSANGTYPADFYGPQGLRYYAPGNEGALDASSYRKIQDVKGQPDAMVKAYRAIPWEGKRPGYTLGQQHINPGDWVTISKQYAMDHGESALNGKYAVAMKRVPAKELFTAGDSFHEWGWHPSAAAEPAPKPAAAEPAAKREIPSVNELLGEPSKKPAWLDIVEKQREVEGMRAAMRDPVTGKIYTGWSHQAAIESVPKGEGEVWGRLHNEWDKATDNAGFVDRSGKFISRDEADKRWKILTMEDLKDLRKKGTTFRANATDQKTGAAIEAANQFGSMAPEGILAYHGSPHDFERFDISKIDTGEGAQSYGHGLYFAENPAVAEDYRKRLALHGANDAEYSAAMQLEGAGGDRELAIAKLRNFMEPLRENDSRRGETQKAIKLLESGFVRPRGRMYEVNIGAHPDQFMNWEAPLSQQRPEVQRVAMKHLFGNPADLTGEDAYRGVKAIYGRHDDASKLFRDEGLPGIRYLDQGSRGVPSVAGKPDAQAIADHKDAWESLVAERRKAAGENQRGDTTAVDAKMDALHKRMMDETIKRDPNAGRTHNYVVFDDKLVKILRKYAIPGAVGGGAAFGSMAPQDQQ